MAQLHFVKHAEIMGISVEQAKNVRRIQVAKTTKVRMLNEYGDQDHVSCLCIPFFASQDVSTHLP